jgi:hypothetical protein
MKKTMRVNTTPEIFANVVRDYVTSLINTRQYITVTPVWKISLQGFREPDDASDRYSSIYPLTANITHVIVKARMEPPTPLGDEETITPDGDDSNYETAFYFQVKKIASECINITVVYKPFCKNYLEMVMQEIKEIWEEPEDICFFDQSIRSIYNTAVIRELLTKVFSGEDFKIFCYDYFPPVYRKFSSGMSYPQEIQFLIEYCERYDKFDELLRQIREANPRQ